MALSKLLPLVAQGRMRQTYHLQGPGRHTLDEQREFARRDIDALAAQVQPLRDHIERVQAEVGVYCRERV